MLDIEIKVYPTNNATFTVTHIDPFTQRRIRDQFDTKIEAEVFRDKLVKKYNQKLKDEPLEMLISELLIQFLRENTKTELNHSKTLLIDFSDTFGSLKLKNLTTDSLRLWMAQLQTENNYSVGTMSGIRARINIFFRYLIEAGVLESTPFEGIHYKARTDEAKSKRTILTKDEIERIIKLAKEYSPGHFYPILLAFVETAAKTNEIINLTWDSIDFKNKTITFPCGTDLTERSIPISSELVRCLLLKRPTSDIVFTNLYKNKFRKKQLTNTLFEFQSRYDMKKKWRYFDLRHSFAYLFLSNGGEIKKLQRIMGHANLNITKDMYGMYRGKEIISFSPFEVN